MPKSFICTVCPEQHSFSRKRKFEAHVQTVQSTLRVRLFSTQKALLLHKLKFHSDYNINIAQNIGDSNDHLISQNIQCGFCNETMSAQEFDLHECSFMLQNQKEKREAALCEHCGVHAQKYAC
jgi:hypothetical protein